MAENDKMSDSCRQWHILLDGHQKSSSMLPNDAAVQVRMARPNTLPGAEQELVAEVTVAMKEAETEEVVTEEVVMAAVERRWG